jgi:hypothetical protein
MTKITTTHYHQGPALLLQSVARGQRKKTVLDIPTSPDQVAPPAYLTLSPPYSVATDEKKDADLSSVVVENDDEVLPTSIHLLPLVLILRTLLRLLQPVLRRPCPTRELVFHPRNFGPSSISTVPSFMVYS